MGRLLILSPGHPHRVTRDEARLWLEARVAEIARAPGVRDARLEPLGSASARRPSDWRWLIEVQLDEAVHHPSEVVDHAPVSDVLLDMRLLGMAPDVAFSADEGAA